MSQKKKSKTTGILIIGLVIIFLWLIKTSYFHSQPNLDYLLPDKTIFTARLNLSSTNTTASQRTRLIENEIIKENLDKLDDFIEENLQNYQIDWPELKNKYLSPQGSFFLTSDTEQFDWGIFADNKNRRLETALKKNNLLQLNRQYREANIYQLADQNETKLYLTFLNRRILVISSSPEINQTVIDNYQNRPDASWQENFSTITLQPILTIKISPELPQYSENNSLLAKLTPIFQPLLGQSSQEFTLTFSQSGNYLNWEIAGPINAEQTTTSSSNLAPLLAEIKLAGNITLGTDQTNINNPEIIENQIFQYLNRLVEANQIEPIKEVLNQINSPLVFRLTNAEAFVLTTPAASVQSLEQIIIGQLARSATKEVNKKLPDGSSYTELIADRDRVKSEISTINNQAVKTFKVDDSGLEIAYYIKNDVIVLSNNQQSLLDNLRKNGTNTPYCLENQSFSQVLDIKNNNYWQNNNFLGKGLKNLEEITVFQPNNSTEFVIKGCLKLN